MSQPAILFLDIDGTLLDANYHSNDPTLPETIKEMQATGKYIFGLNSNRSIDDMLPTAETFGISGPVIGENGVFAYYPASGHVEYFLDNDERNGLVRLKTSLETLIRQQLTDYFKDRQVFWLDTDTVSAISDGIDMAAYSNGDIVVLNNVFRKYTTSAHILTCKSGKLVRLPVEDMKKVLALITQTFTGEGLTITYDHKFSNILGYSMQTSKRAAVEKLIASYPDYQLYSIGDDINDYHMTEGIGRFLTTANAASHVKYVAMQVADSKFAKGVHELLHSLKNMQKLDDSNTIKLRS